MDRRLINAEEVGLKRLRSFVRSKLRSHEAFIEVDYGAYSHTYCVTESAKLLVVLKNASIEIDKDSTSSNLVSVKMKEIKNRTYGGCQRGRLKGCAIIEVHREL